METLWALATQLPETKRWAVKAFPEAMFPLSSVSASIARMSATLAVKGEGVQIPALKR